MWIKHLKLINFRNYQTLDVDFAPGALVIYGDNGQGKTNLVESLVVLSLLKSFREEERANLIMKGQDQAVLEAKASGISSKQLKVLIRKEGIEAFVNDKKERSQNSFIGQINVVSFVPRDVFLFKDSPRERRDFLDNEISKLSPAYEMAIRDYYKLLRERNESLSQPQVNETLLKVLTQKLALLDAEIRTRRYDFIAKLNQHLSEIYSGVTGTPNEFKLVYESFLPESENVTADIVTLMLNRYEEDRARHTTSIGIHRDDLRGYLNGDDVGSFASQGQQRLCVVALKLVLIDYIGAETGEQPIVVLDDILSELDEAHQKSLINHLQGKNQLFLTASSLAPEIKQELAKKGQIFNVINGNILKELV